MQRTLKSTSCGFLSVSAPPSLSPAKWVEMYSRSAQVLHSLLKMRVFAVIRRGKKIGKTERRAEASDVNVSLIDDSFWQRNCVCSTNNLLACVLGRRTEARQFLHVCLGRTVPPLKSSAGSSRLLRRQTKIIGIRWIFVRLAYGNWNALEAKCTLRVTICGWQTHSKENETSRGQWKFVCFFRIAYSISIIPILLKNVTFLSAGVFLFSTYFLWLETVRITEKSFSARKRNIQYWYSWLSGAAAIADKNKQNILTRKRGERNGPRNMRKSLLIVINHCWL